MFNPSYPASAGPRPDDLVTYEQFTLFMEPSGHTLTVRTAQRWAIEDRLPTWPDPADPRRRRQLVSVSDLLVAHRNRQS